MSTMELILTRVHGTQMAVSCDGASSHTCPVDTLLSMSHLHLTPEQALDAGKTLYDALFPLETLAHQRIAGQPERIVLVAMDEALDALPWEYASGPAGLLVLTCHFVRGLPVAQRRSSPPVSSPLHSIAIPSQPLSESVPPLSIESEWQRLKESIAELPYALTLERTRPPTLEQLRALVAQQQGRVVHFMGHGGRDEQGAFLCFERENGELARVSAQQLAQRLRGTTFLVTLNACHSAGSGETVFSNLARTLVTHQIPYALGMRFSIPDEDARAFSRAFYRDLARGSSVEEALLQARLTLAESQHPWAVGLPVLYTCLAEPAAGLTVSPGTPHSEEHQSPLDLMALPRVEGTFQGRRDALMQLGSWLTGDERKRIVTIHGFGGQGKTALAREAAERFAFAWPGGVWAISFENLPSRALFVTELARLLGIPTHETLDEQEQERRVMQQVQQRRTLLVLDNVETLIEAVQEQQAAALALAELLQQLPSPLVSLLVTSRLPLGWIGECSYALDGLAPKDGTTLFYESAPQRHDAQDRIFAWKLSEQVDGHPLSLRLLGSAFNATKQSFQEFLQECATHLLEAENRYKHLEHRHRSLNACIEISLRYLDEGTRTLLGQLWVFHASFQPQAVIAMLDETFSYLPFFPEQPSQHVLITQLQTLWTRGLLTRESISQQENALSLYRLFPVMRFYIEQHLRQKQEHSMLLSRFGSVYASLVHELSLQLDKNQVAVSLALSARADLERGWLYVSAPLQAAYLHEWGWVVQRLGDRHTGLAHLEDALERVQGQDRQREIRIENDIAGIFQQTGKPDQALVFYQRVLTQARAIGDHTGEAMALNDMAGVYQRIGDTEQALSLYEQALARVKAQENQVGEAALLNNMALLYADTGQIAPAFTCALQALQLLQQQGDQVGEATALNNLGLLCMHTSRFADALTFYQCALPLRQRLGDQTGEAETLNNMALLAMNIGQTEQALSLYQQSLHLRHRVEDQVGEAATLHNMAIVYVSLGNLEQALALLQQALPLARVTRDRAGEAKLLNAQASIFVQQGHHQQALTLYQQVIALFRELQDRAGEGATRNNMATLLVYMGQLEQAVQWYQQAIYLHQQTENRAGEAAVRTSLAILYYDRLAQPQEALSSLTKACALLHQWHLPQDATGRTTQEVETLLKKMQQGEARS